VGNAILLNITTIRNGYLTNASSTIIIFLLPIVHCDEIYTSGRLFTCRSSYMYWNKPYCYTCKTDNECSSMTCSKEGFTQCKFKSLLIVRELVMLRFMHLRFGLPLRVDELGLCIVAVISVKKKKKKKYGKSSFINNYTFRI